MTRRRFLAVPLLALCLVASGCARLCKVLNQVDPVHDGTESILRRALAVADLALPRLAPDLAAGYALVREGLEAALDAGHSACAAADTGTAPREPDVEAGAARRALAFLRWFRDHADEIAAASPPDSRAVSVSPAELAAAIERLERVQ